MEIYFVESCEVFFCFAFIVTLWLHDRQLVKALKRLNGEEWQ